MSHDTENLREGVEVTDEGIDVKVEDKLTNWKNEPSIRQIKQHFTDASTFHDSHVENVKDWLNYLNITGNVKRKVTTTRSSVSPKLIRKQAEWRYAALSEPFLSTDELFETEPRTFEDNKASEQAGLVLNHQFNTKIEKVAFIDEYVRTAVDEGTVVIRVGWDFEEEEIEVEVPIFKDQRILPDVQTLELNIPEVPISVESVQIGTKIQIQTRVIKNQPTVEICNFRNITTDPTAQGDIEKMNFIIYSYETSLSELKKDGKYVNLESIDTSKESILDSPDSESFNDTNFVFRDKPRAKFTAYEYWGFWDIDNSGIVKPITATYVGDVLIYMKENPYPDGKLPFVFVSYLPVRKSIYGEPDGALLKDNQQIIGAVTRGIIDTISRTANGQMGIQKGVLDVPNKRKFDKGLDYEFNNNTDPRSAFFTHTFPQISSTAEYMLNQQNLEAESITGVKVFNEGITGSALGRTATGIRSALDATAKRELGILRRFAEGIKQIGRKIMAMNSEFLSDKEVIRITNEEFIEIDKEDLAGNYDVKLTISTAEADNEKAKELAFMLQTVGNNMNDEMSRMILAKIAKLRNMPELAKQIDSFKPQPDPMAQRTAELEQLLLEAQIKNETAKAAENAVDVGLKTAKTRTELAKGRNLNSKSDKQDLDFLEQDQGVQHERDLETQDLKRKSDLDLKAADKLLNAEEQLSA